jgi:hypothetical protein
MTFKARLMMFSAALALSAGMANAAPITAADVLQSYTEAGFSAIEIRETATTIKVEAVKDGVRLELVYDKASGDVIKREQGADTGQSSSTAGVDDHDEQGDDDEAGSDDGPDHDAGDDHGSEHDGGHDGGDDSGDDSSDN